MRRQPAAPSRPHTIKRYGYVHWSVDKFSTPTCSRKWLASPAPESPAKPDGQKYGYGITKISFGPNSIYFHGGELPGFNSFIGHDPANDVTLIVCTNLTLSAEGQVTANAVMLKVLDQIYVESPLKK